jgi:hypothetical protein
LASNSFIAAGVARLALPLRNQEVAGVAILDLDEIAEVAEVDDLFHQNNLHRRILDYWWLSV